MRACKGVDSDKKKTVRGETEVSRKRTPKKKPRAEVSKYNPMPIYRAYGHTKKEYWLWEEFLAFIQKTVAVCFLLLIFSVIFLCFKYSVY